MASKTQKKLDSLILEGINITLLSQEIDAIYRDENIIDESFRRFNIWKIDIRDFLELAKLNNINWSVFYESDSVPLMKGGIDYADIESKKSQELLKNIRTETKKYLGSLRDLSNEMFGEVSTNTNKVTVCIDPIIGICRKENKAKKYSIKNNSDRKKMIDLLLSQEDDNAFLFLNDFRKELNKNSDSSFFNKEIKEINKNFREGLGVKNDLILKVKTGGYRINRDDFFIESS